MINRFALNAILPIVCNFLEIKDFGYIAYDVVLML